MMPFLETVWFPKEFTRAKCDNNTQTEVQKERMEKEK